MTKRVTTVLVSIAAFALLGAQPASADRKVDSVLTGPEDTSTRVAGGRIVGGSPTDISSFPYQAAILDQIGLSQFCGGSVIRPRIVLTAAHCLFAPAPFALGDQVVVGTTDWTVGGEQRTVIDAAAHPSYNPAVGPEAGYDVGLLLLDTPVSVPHVKLAGPDEARLWRQLDPATVAGWGRTSEGGTSSTSLLSAVVPIISDVECPAYYGGSFIASVMVCAGYQSGGIDACQGDSGGPLAVPAFGGEGGSVRQVGVVSWGAGCARPFAPGVYSRVGQDPLQGYVQGTVNSSPDPGDVIGSGGDRCLYIFGKSRKKKKARAICACQEDKFGAARKKCIKKAKRKFSKRRKKKKK